MLIAVKRPCAKIFPLDQPSTQTMLTYIHGVGLRPRGTMRIESAITCVHYDDFLACTLPHNLSQLESITVVTSPHDPATIRLAKQLGVDLFITDAFHIGGSFNKALALNQWMEHVSPLEADAWLMTIDADILLFEAVSDGVDQLDARCLYSVRRRMCEDTESFGDLLSGNKRLSDFPLDSVPVRDGKLWGTIQSRNPAGLAGYFQMWCPAASAAPQRFPVTGTAEAYDLTFGLTFPDDARHYLQSVEALHIGPTEINWAGRRSPRWEPSGAAT